MKAKNERASAPIPHFSYVGRLVREKGVDRVIAFAKILLESEDRIGTLAIYGEGPFRIEMFRELSGYSGFQDLSRGEKMDESKRVRYFGHRPKEEIKEALDNTHYLLMPSRFLETFGLSALEAISQGVVVVGYSKGGLSQFLLPELAVVDAFDEDKDMTNFLIRGLEIVETYSGEKFDSESERSRAMLEKFNADAWKKSVAKHVWNGSKRLLIVSDYREPIGGIETHMHTIRGFLSEMGHVVEIWSPLSGKSRISRLFGLAFAIFNPVFSWKLKKKISEYKPDIIWMHSVSRAIGPMWLGVIDTKNVRTFKTYHDLGYFGAYATQFEHEYDLVGELSFATFYREAPLVDRCLPFYLVAKYLRLKLISRQLRKFEKHFVPSPFMKEAVISFLSDPKAEVFVLPHAVDLWK